MYERVDGKQHQEGKEFWKVHLENQAIPAGKSWEAVE